MNLFDTSVLLDIATADPIWLAWSEMQSRIATQGPILVNPIIYAELAPAFAHAESEHLTLVTRDAARYGTYFPTVTLITPP